MTYTNCFVCNALVPDMDGPVSKHTYMPQSPGCWKLFTDILGKEYDEWQYPEIHRLMVDCYAAQHPTKENNQKSAQSIIVHLVSIYLILKKNYTAKQATLKIKKLIEKNKENFIWLEPPRVLGSVTVSDIYKATNLEEHIELVKKWALSIWNAWGDKHEAILFYLND